MAEVSIEPLGRILLRLREVVALYEREPDNMVYLDSLIKRFELAYELSRNTLYRYLQESSVHLRGGEGQTLATMIRTANQDGLLRGTWEQWSRFRDARNETAHAFNEMNARSIASKVPAFLEEAEYLYEQMRIRLEQR